MCYFGDRDVTEKSKKYPGLEQLSTAELEDLLRRDFAASGDDNASMALITEIMEVIQAREAQQELPVDEDTAWEMFLERNIRNAVTSNEEVPDMDKTQNICHYIAKNIDTYIAVWLNGNVECFIQGNLSEDDIKMMIDSIYE